MNELLALFAFFYLFKPILFWIGGAILLSFLLGTLCIVISMCKKRERKA